MLELISDYIGPLITTLGGLLFVKKVFFENIKSNILFLSLCIILIPFVALILDSSEYLIYRTFILCILCTFLFKYAFKSTVYESFLYSIVYMIMLIVSEMVIFVILTMVLRIDIDFLYNDFAGGILSNLIICGLAILFGYFLRRWLSRLCKIKITNYFILYVIFLFICIIFFFYVTFSNIGHGINVFSGIAVIIILLFVLYNLLVQVYKNNQLILKYDKLLDFIKKYEIEIDKQRTMRHEIRNQLLTIKSKLLDNDMNQSIINYINEIIEDNNKVINHTLYAKFNSLPSNGIKGLFYFKVSEAIDKKINVDVNISKVIKNSVLGNLNSTMFNQLGKLFGILLDNAIESAELSIDKKIGIEIYSEDGKVIFIVSNTYFSTIKHNNLFSSTKGECRGHGLLLAKAIINSSSRFDLNTIITDKLYTQILTIK